MTQDDIKMYRCFLLDGCGEVVAFEHYETADPDEAIAWAKLCLAARPHHKAVEVWDGGRRLYPKAAAA